MEDVNNTKVCSNSGDQDGNEDICKSRNLAIFGYILIQFIRSIFCIIYIVKQKLEYFLFSS